METLLDNINKALRPKAEEENEPIFLVHFEFQDKATLRVTLNFKGCEEIAASKDYKTNNLTRTEIYELELLKGSLRDGDSECEKEFRMLPFGIIRLIDFSKF